MFSGIGTEYTDRLVFSEAGEVVQGGRSCAKREGRLYGMGERLACFQCAWEGGGCDYVVWVGWCQVVTVKVRMSQHERFEDATGCNMVSKGTLLSDVKTIVEVRIVDGEGLLL